MDGYGSGVRRASSFPLDAHATPVTWLVLCYLTGEDAGSLAALLAEVASERVAVLVQHDGPDGASRHVLSREGGAAWRDARGPVDSGAREPLAEFVHWGLSRVRAERVALVVQGRGAREDTDDAPFTLCRDERTDHALHAVDFGAALATALSDAERPQLDLVLLDVDGMQFLELAHELDGRVRVLVAPQTAGARAAWDYGALVRTFREGASSGTGEASHDTAALAVALTRSLVGDVAAWSEHGALSALDLERLADVSRAFDTLCIGTMQALGAGIVWEGRALLIQLLDAAAGERNAYDAGSLFVLMAAVMEAMADEATQGWLATTLSRKPPETLAAFREELARALTREPGAAEHARLGEWLAVLRSERSPEGARRLLHALREDVLARVQTITPKGDEPAQYARLSDEARASDELVRRGVMAAFRELSAERRLDFQRAEDGALAARRLSAQAQQAAVALLGAGAARFGVAQDDGRAEGAVLAATGPQRGWPRASGVSLHRPPDLDQLMDSSYQRFRFHERVHWAALLGAANLIDKHPRALWRLVSSLLSTGGVGTRRDVLGRLTGDDSVIWGLRSQFRAMAPARALTLSLERRTELGSSPGANAASEHYLLRLESAATAAVVTEQHSRVQPRVLNRALGELEALLTAPLGDQTLDRLRSIGSQLGEDIFQTLGRTLEDEREAALDGSSATVHLLLQLPHELMPYPWELLHQRGEWLSERFAMGRQVYMQTGLARRVPRRRQGRVRVLVVGDPLLDDGVPYPQLPAARAEAEQVAGAFERLRKELGEVIDFERERDALVHVRVTNDELRRRLRDGAYDIIHFAGHGVFEPRDPEASAWVLSDGHLWALEIRNTLLEHPAPPWLVFANACEAGREGARASYQGNVFGLASAFLNQGVAAYVAPLWALDDLVAQTIALSFYRYLLCERASLGDALRRAKIDARVATVGPESPGAASSLGWASLTLYGDPTQELFQALAGSAERAPEPLRAPRPSSPSVRPRAPFIHAPDHVVDAWVGDPRAPRGKDAEELDALELVEEAGLRRFRILRRQGPVEERGAERVAYYESLPGSSMARLLKDERLRSELPAQRGALRIIGRWALSGFSQGMFGLAREYDRDRVPREGLLHVGEREVSPLRRDVLAASGRRSERVLLLIHGTFSNTASPVEGFGREFLGWARQHYAAVLGLDHWTLSKTPLENAQMLLDQLRAIAPELLEGRRIDIITHSRGGLVARAFCELLEQGPRVSNLVFLGTPNCGTDLANPRHFGALADLLVNLTGLDHAEILGRAAGFLARLAVAKGEQRVPGLLAQNPLMADDASSFLASLQLPDRDRFDVRHACITAEFEPSPLVPDLRKLLGRAAALGVDAVVDRFFASANDLVVNTAHVWCLDRGPTDLGTLPSFVRPDRVLAFVPRSSTLALPAGIARETAVGVHHCNLFGQLRTQRAIKGWLTDSAA